MILLTLIMRSMPLLHQVLPGQKVDPQIAGTLVRVRIVMVSLQGDLRDLLEASEWSEATSGGRTLAVLECKEVFIKPSDLSTVCSERFLVGNDVLEG